MQAGVEAFSDGETDRAGELAFRALEFAQDSSDALTLLALVEADEQMQTATAIARLETALESAGFALFSPVEASIVLAALYNRTGRPEDALELLEPLVLPPNLEWRERSDYWYQLAHAYLLSGFAEEADQILIRARDLHPNDARLFRLALGREPFPSLEHRREVDRLLAARDTPTAFDAEPRIDDLLHLLLDYGRAAPLESEVIWAADRYRELGGRDPFVSTLYLRTSDEEAARAFEELGGASSVQSISAFADADRLTLIRDSVDSFTGVSRLDMNMDGFWELEFEVADGAISRVRRDGDQDGRLETDVRVESGVISEAMLNREDVIYRLSYGLYPYVHEVAVVTEGGEERFILEPRRSTVRLFEAASAHTLLLADVPQLREQIRVPTISELRETAVRVDRFDQDGVRRTRIYQAVGQMVFTGTDEDGDGAFDVLTAQEAGFAVRRLRDIDFDGYFEVVEEFRGGRMIARAIDEDDDGFPEILDYERTASIRDWDLNEDGRIDVREFRNWGDSVIREFPLLEQQ